MRNVIMIGCDLHDRTMLLKYAVGTDDPQQLSYDNDAAGRRRMIYRLKSLAETHKCNRIVFVYEASGLGHGLSDQLNDERIECHVLSPSHLPKTPKSAKQKTDARDAQMLFEHVRGHVLAGNSLAAVWTPPPRLRNDRELLRARVDVADEIARVKLKVGGFLKHFGIQLVCPTKTKWTKAHVRILRSDVVAKMDYTIGVKLEQLLRRLEMYQSEQLELDKAIKRLSKEDRYKKPCKELREIPGVGLLVAMTFLTEMGDLTRFHNRREVGAYMGLCPSSHESGEVNDRKGRITRQGPARLRKILCQAAWASISRSDKAAADYHRIRQNQKKRTKKALVALMRKLGIKMWHRALEQGVSPELKGRGGPHGLKEPRFLKPQ
jgi:transposase